jgi:hypothetical protein
MKKTISTILVCVLLLGSLLSLSSCEVAGFVFGTYSRTDTIIFDITTTCEFSLTEVTKTVTTDNLIGNGQSSTTETMKYKVTDNEDGEKVIVFTVETEDGSKITEYSFNSGSDDGGAYIEINGIRYYSVK